MSNQKDDVVLVVDDSLTNLLIITEALQKGGIVTQSAVDGESALALIAQTPPALILLDVEMPRLSGFETCRQLKANPMTQDIPIIFTTAFTDTEYKVKGFSLGAVDYIPKPFSPAEVIARVQVHLKLRALSNQLEQRVADRTAALLQAQAQMEQREKLSVLGQLVAGIAHEMNNPIGCIVSNLTPIRNYIGNLTKLLERYQKEHPDPSEALEMAVEEADLEFILSDIPKLLNSLELSAARIKDLTVSLRNFARGDNAEEAVVDIHAGLDSTLVILHHRFKPIGYRPQIEVAKHYGQLPPVKGYPTRLNQVFMNLLANAIDALEEQFSHLTAALPLGQAVAAYSPQITIRTEAGSGYITITIADNGPGMTAEVKAHIFEQLYTTKPIGQGTGLGLAIAHQIVTEKHGGTLEVISEPNQGAAFVVTLPHASA
ncbi:response regulator [Romeria aff. gracilis LEGE 07310]|uniref:histidine kinase n=1 Tax=Vasconcelosia minhoensis LEGE 07310 TaxID=915328 RepID=A0A8J7AT25_9CYAN|nr:response regulator [Romeria gracilis]MBE9079434.1 response regulator [Romeria aff. gracilis LEGE 07310]